ncbi:MAG: hypothetical protein HPY62_05575, partial [Bacteroidales bacterium]|nr:hypothetical protein [Bacteroidales bacterium]
MDPESPIMIAVIIVLQFLIFSCNKDKDEIPPKPPKVYLNVEVGQGVDGYPRAGVYEYDTGMAVNYGYRALEGYINLVTTIDGNIIPDNGSFKIRKDHNLKSVAEQKVLWRYNTTSPVYFSVPAAGKDKTV